MARLPAPGGDNGTWGVILNDYLSVSLDTGGALKADTVNTSQIADSAVTVAKISGAGTGNSVATLSGGTIPEAQLPTVSRPSNLTSTFNGIGSMLPPTGGTTGQLLRKTSNTNHDMSWVSPGFANVAVVTGSEARPSASFVLWVGGSTQPTNMAVGDVWMKAA